MMMILQLVFEINRYNPEIDHLYYTAFQPLPCIFPGNLRNDQDKSKIQDNNKQNKKGGHIKANSAAN